ncbi:MAG: chemotaxis protein CheW [Planctomycetaceae bacterium]|nr:chemotaxis protein CheW [Planctomycetaceae bacterium]
MVDSGLSITRSVDKMVVRIEHLDKLLNLAGEVIITSSTLHELQRTMVDAVTHHKTLDDSSLQTIKSANETSRRISQDLHDLVMAIRMVEIGETFRMFRRPIRDLARNLKKEIDLKFEGEKVLIDKALAERLVEPLLHLLRNAADHGLEAPIERIRDGKPEKGTITLCAVEHENETEIFVIDDGRGIDERKVFEKAAALGMTRPGETPDLLNLICSSGFSILEKATDTSGRGVGLDLVRTMVREFGGEMSITNLPKVGFTFRMQIPKLKAVNIIDALIVRGGSTLFAFSIDKVLSLQGLPQNQIHSAMDREPFIKYMGTPIPLFDIGTLFGMSPTWQRDSQVVPVAVLEGGGRQVAVVVSEFLSPQKLVNVPLNTDMFGVKPQGIAGTCIINEGRIGLTVDVDVLLAIAVGDSLENVAAEVDTSFGSAVVKKTDEPRQYQPTEIVGQVVVAHSQTELVQKAKLSMKRDEIAEKLENGQKELSEGDASDLLDELSRGLIELQDNFLTLENETANPELMKECFRRLHAAKGNFTMLGATNSADLAHGMETLLDFLRKDRLSMSQELMDILLDGIADLNKATKLLPKSLPPANVNLLQRIDTVVQLLMEQEVVTDPEKLLGTAFTLTPNTELQLLGALKQGAYTYETFFRFTPGRQANYLVAYMMLRKLCFLGTIISTLPAVEDIEKGNCGTAIKVLWASHKQEADLKKSIDEWTPFFNVVEHQTIPTTVFRYDSGADV